MDKTARDIARENGLPMYYAGERCSNGHDAQRYTRSGACVQCTADTMGRIDAERKADKALHAMRAQYGEAGEFARNVSVVRVHVPLALIESVQTVAVGMLRQRFPTMGAEHLTCEPMPTQSDGTRASVRVLVHNDDCGALRSAIKRAQLAEGWK